MNRVTKIYYRFRRTRKSVVLQVTLVGPGLVVLIADNDAGGITTRQIWLHLMWFLLILIPVAYYVQEMTVGLGAVTKRGHAEAIFDVFNSLWAWFSLVDLFIVDWLARVIPIVDDEGVMIGAIKVLSPGERSNMAAKLPISLACTTRE